ncbi:MAG: right-handed parallel beta-helix repeat-containing protein, partial [Gammaproteobacteria bacterium]|nr:right-handed parallel beta-helix repeat-containing protein [Gammaproteobacteria bacterium]
AQQAWGGVLGQISVTTNVDQLDADADTTSLAGLALNPGSDGLVSLREAIKAANTDTGADTIFLDAATYTISSTAAGDDGGDFDIRDDLAIVGVSPTATAIDGDNAYRVFQVHADDPISVSFNDLAIRNGFINGAEGNDGAALKIGGSPETPSVFVDNVWFHDNDSTAGSSVGGAIYNRASLTIENSLLEANAAFDGGGAIWTEGGTLAMTNVTVHGNTVQNGSGGGLFQFSGSTTLRNVTVAQNDAQDAGAGTGQGGGIYVAAGTVDIANSIIADNDAEGSGKDVSGAFTDSGSNLVKNQSTSTGFVSAPTDPNLAGLADNGGPLKTVAPDAGGPARDAGNAVLAPAVDQRGFLRDDGSPDIGAYEVGADETPVELQLHLATRNDVTGGGQPGLDTWERADLLTIGDPDLYFGEAGTSGTVALAIDVDDFAPGVDLLSAHLVSRNLPVGTSGFQLLAGDLVFMADGASVFTSNNLAPLDPGFEAVVNSTDADLLVFRPDTPGDYSTGGFALLIEDVSGTGDRLNGITLVEQDVTVGGTLLEAGDFLFSDQGSATGDINWYQTGTTGTGATPDGRPALLLGADAGIDIDNNVRGLELLEETSAIGGRTLAAGTLLVSVEDADLVGTNGLNVDEHDIFALDVRQSTLAAGAGNGVATASRVFDGSQIGFDSSDEEISALALAPSAGIIGAHYLDRFDTAGSYAGDDGSLSWSNDWQEFADSAGAVGGKVAVYNGFFGDGGGNVELAVGADGGVWREADLSGATSATLSFSYTRENLLASDALVVYAQASGVSGGISITGAPGTWTEIGRYSGPGTDGAYLGDAIDISGFIAADTRIMFFGEGMTPASRTVFIDDARIDLAGYDPPNVAPVLAGANDLADIAEDPVANPGTLVADLVSGQIADPDAGALEGIAVIAVDDSNGTWEYTTNGGANWFAFGAVSTSNTRLLAADPGTLVRFVPDPDWNGAVVDGITFRAWDRTTGGNGDTMDLTGGTVRDEFSVPLYSNNDGSGSWAGDWVEFSDDGDPGGGNITIAGGQLRLANHDGGDLESI